MACPIYLLSPPLTRADSVKVSMGVAASQKMGVANVAPPSQTSLGLNSLRHHVERTLPSLTNKFQRALTMAEDTLLPKSQQVRANSKIWERRNKLVIDRRLS